MFGERSCDLGLPCVVWMRGSGCRLPPPGENGSGGVEVGSRVGAGVVALERLSPKDPSGRYMAAPGAPVRATRSGKVKSLVETLQGEGKEIHFSCSMEEENVVGDYKGGLTVPSSYHRAILNAEEVGGDLNEEVMEDFVEGPQPINETRVGDVEAVLDPTICQQPDSDADRIRALLHQQRILYSEQEEHIECGLHEVDLVGTSPRLQQVGSVVVPHLHGALAAFATGCTAGVCGFDRKSNSVQNLDIFGPIAGVIQGDHQGDTHMEFQASRSGEKSNFASPEATLHAESGSTAADAGKPSAWTRPKVVLLFSREQLGNISRSNDVVDLDLNEVHSNLQKFQTALAGRLFLKRIPFHILEVE